MDDYTLASLLRKQVTAHEVNDRRVAVTFAGTDLTYEDLDDRSERLAAALAQVGFDHGDRLGVLLHNCLEWVEVFFAVAKLGGVVVPINHLLSPAEIAFVVRDSGARWAVSGTTLAPGIDRDRLGADMPRVILVDQASEDGFDYRVVVEANGPAPEWRDGRPPVRAGDLVLLQYTSGTTGSPKGAMHTHSTVLWNAMHQIVDYGVTADDVFLVVPALCWAAGFHDIALATLWRGGRVVLAPTTGFSPEWFLSSVAAERVTATVLVPTVLRRVLAEPAFGEHDLSSLRLICSGGEPVPKQMITEMSHRLPGCSLVQAYGMSEFPTMMLYLDPRYALEKLGSAGRACNAAEIRIVNGEGEDTGPGEIGEIWCRSPATMIGYYRKPEATAETLAGGWLHTGDLARRDEDGFVYVSGRAKDMIITGGLNVYAAEVEAAIGEHPAVIEAAVVGIPDDDWGEVGHAMVVLRAGHNLDRSELVAYLRENIAHYKVPRQYTFTTEQLPRTTSGKVQKFRVRELLKPETSAPARNG